MTEEDARKVVCHVGELIIMSNGKYSDYCHYGVYEVLIELNEEVLVKLSIGPDIDHDYGALDRVIELLVARNYVRRLAYKELYLGAYSKIDPSIVNEYPYGETESEPETDGRPE